MKILHILDHSLPLHSGYTFRSASLFREQQRRGWTPVVVTSPKHEASWKEDPGATKEAIGGIAYYRSGALPANNLPVVPELLLMKRLERRIVEVASRERPDLLHAHSPVLNGIAALGAGRRLGLPVVYEIRAFWEDAAVDHGTTREGSLRYRLTRGLETWACRRMDHVAVLCRGLQAELIDRGIDSDKISVVYNGVDPDTFRSVPTDEALRDAWNLRGKVVIGFLGSFYRYEGLDLLVRSFARLAQEREDARLLLVGGGETAAELRALVGRLHLEGRVVMPGRVPHERVPGIYAFVDILAFPRYRMRLTDLVTPLKPLEAMAMGKAVVASDVGGHREQIQHGQTGLLFPAGDEDALIEALGLLAEDRALRERLGTAGRIWVDTERTWARTTRIYENIYRSILPPLARGNRVAGSRHRHEIHP